MIVLDTNVISELFKPQPDSRVVSWIESCTDEVAITAVTLAELLAGVEFLPAGRRKSQLSQAINRVADSYRDSTSILPFDERAAEHYAHVVSSRTKAGTPINTADAQIAAICLAHTAVCATRNTKDFALTEVQLINPWVENSS